MFFFSGGKTPIAADYQGANHAARETRVWDPEAGSRPADPKRRPTDPDSTSKQLVGCKSAGIGLEGIKRSATGPLRHVCWMWTVERMKQQLWSLMEVGLWDTVEGVSWGVESGFEREDVQD